MRFEGTSAYVATDDLKVAVNAAITLERPLLVKGEPVIVIDDRLAVDQARATAELGREPRRCRDSGSSSRRRCG